MRNFRKNKDVVEVNCCGCLVILTIILTVAAVLGGTLGVFVRVFSYAAGW